MRRRDLFATTAILVLGATPALAQTRAQPSAQPKATASAAHSASAATSAAQPAAGGALPPGHPAMNAPAATGAGATADDEGDPAAADAHAQAGVPGAFKAPEDTETEDPSLAPGTIAVDLRDADDKPIANEDVTLGILVQSIAKGESRTHKLQQTDASGRAIFAQLESGTGFAYRVTVPKDGATFAAVPFQLQQGKAMRVVLHLYPVTRDIKEARVVIRGVLLAEMRDDRVQFQQAFQVYNFGRFAWVPDNVFVTLPAGFTAFNTQQGMGDQGVDPVPTGAHLRGTFGPGQQQVIEFRWQLPWSGEPDVEADVGLPPHVPVMQVMAAASQKMRLEVDGFPPAQSHKDNQGQNLLVTEKQLASGESLSSVHFALRDLPTPGPARWIATATAACAVLIGLVFASTGGRQRAGGGGRVGDAKSARKQLLAELEELERARASGEVGPKTYDRARREIIDAIARTLHKSTE
jgi:hypothetical protein